jgi:hypothetical protein
MKNMHASISSQATQSAQLFLKIEWTQVLLLETESKHENHNKNQIPKGTPDIETNT